MRKTIVVTGASRGIGYETTVALAEASHRVIALARSENKLNELKKNAPETIQILAADLTDSKQIHNVSRFVEKHTTGLDGLVHCAGALVNKPFEELTDRDWNKMLDVNLLSAVKIVRTLIPQFNPGAHIVNISSMGGFQGSVKFEGLAAYSVVKGAVSILSECLAVEFERKKIKSNALCLGAVQTEMLEQAFPGFKAPVSARQMGTYIADFTLQGATFYNGKILPVALDNPE